MVDVSTAIVVNPRSRARAGLRAAALARLEREARVVAVLETRGDGGDRERVAALLGAHSPDVLAALGGDGTAGLAGQALLDAGAAARTALALLPLGTGDNVARSLGLRPLSGGEGALARAVDTLCHGPRAPMDVGVVSGRPFLGSVALGMDADVLAVRNRAHRRLAKRAVEGGYPLYLAAFAASATRRRHGGRARLWLDGACETRELFNLVVVNAPVYAGPFRFDGPNDCADGLLDVHASASLGDILSEYPRAWLRYLRVGQDRPAAPSPRLRRVRALRVEFDEPVPAHADGEELEPARVFDFRVLPGALRVCRPGARSVRPPGGVSGAGAAGRSR